MTFVFIRTRTITVPTGADLYNPFVLSLSKHFVAP
jgi:hypothetical protein